MQISLRAFRAAFKAAYRTAAGTLARPVPFHRARRDVVVFQLAGRLAVRLRARSRHAVEKLHRAGVPQMDRNQLPRSAAGRLPEGERDRHDQHGGSRGPSARRADPPPEPVLRPRLPVGRHAARPCVRRRLLAQGALRDGRAGAAVVGAAHSYRAGPGPPTAASSFRTTFMPSTAKSAPSRLPRSCIFGMAWTRTTTARVSAGSARCCAKSARTTRRRPCLRPCPATWAFPASSSRPSRFRMRPAAGAVHFFEGRCAGGNGGAVVGEVHRG